MLKVEIETYSRNMYVNRYYRRKDKCLTYSDAEVRRRIAKLAQCWINDSRVPAFTKFSSRLSWCNKRYFIKLDNDFCKSDGQGQSEREWRNWEEHKTARYSKWLVPVLAHGVLRCGRHWVLQPRINFLHEDKVSTDQVRAGWRKIRRTVNTLNLWDVGDQQGAGWAFNADTYEPIIYDYGF